MSEQCADDPAAQPHVAWMYRYGLLYVEWYSTLREAIESAKATEDNGDGSLHRIEGPSTPEQIKAAVDAYRAEQQAAADALHAAEFADKRPRLYVLAKAPERDGWVTVEWTRDPDVVEAARARLAAAIGADRVKVTSRRPR